MAGGLRVAWALSDETPTLVAVRRAGQVDTMADTPEDRQSTEALRRRVPAYALLRACVTQDQDAAVLLVDQARQAGSLDLLVFNMAHVAARAMLSAEGYDVAKVLDALDHWLEVASSGVPGPKGRAA